MSIIYNNNCLFTKLQKMHYVKCTQFCTYHEIIDGGKAMQFFTYVVKTV